MKKIGIIIGTLLIAFIYGCEKDYEPLMSYSDVGWYNSGSNKPGNNVGVNQYFSFTDLSQGALEHRWELIDGEGTNYLTGAITRDNKEYESFIDEDKGLVTEDKTIHVLFTEPGLKSVRLYNTFADSVIYKGNDTIPAVKVGDMWVMDTTFIVDVYGEMKPELKVAYTYEDEETGLPVTDTLVNLTGEYEVPGDTAEWAKVTIKAGEFIDFIDFTTIDRPTGRTWNIEGGSPSNSGDSAAIVNFYRLGTFYPSFTTSRSATNIPGGSASTAIPLVIEVVKSDLAFEVVGNVQELPNQTLQLVLNGEIAPLQDEEENFTITITNKGTNIPMMVKTAKVNESEGNIIDLQLDGEIYNTDIITVTWANGTIISLDGRELTPLTNVPVDMYMPNLITDPGFESGGGNWSAPDDSDGTSQYSTLDPASGSYCYRLFVGEGQSRAAGLSKESFKLTAGKKYLWTYKHKTTSGGSGGFEPQIVKKNADGDVVRLNGFWTSYKNGQGWQDGPQVGWAQDPLYWIWSATEDVDEAFIHLLSYSESEMFFDDLNLYEYEQRP